MAGKLAKKINRILTYPERKKVRSIIANPPEVVKNRIVFTSTEDFSDNPLALYQYLIENGYNEKYEIIWLFEFDKNYRELNTANVRSIRMRNSRGVRTAEAQEAILSAGYVFFSHNVNWAKNFRPEQTYVDLWHGCGYKGRQPGETRVINFDYCTVTGPKYAKELVTHYLCDESKLVATGYARNDWFKTDRSNAASYAEQLKKDRGADKLILWMPTFRKSKVDRITTTTSIGSMGLPLIDNEDDMKLLDSICREKGIVLAIKKHVLQAEDKASEQIYTNIVNIGNDTLKEENVLLYELLAKTDALLTDYSSVAIDYMLLDKPIGYILTDYDEYDQVRGWCYDNVLDYMAGDHIYGWEDLEDFLYNVAKGNDGHADWRHKILPEVQTQADSYCKNILDRFGIEK